MKNRARKACVLRLEVTEDCGGDVGDIFVLSTYSCAGVSYQ
jgi:hypothetical protein